MKSYIATFHGDLDLLPLVDSSLVGLLDQIVRLTGWGECHSEEWSDKAGYHSYDYYITPDPEDDKVEIWEIDLVNKTAEIVSGFWGWHWSPPNGDYELQMILPGHTKSLYDLAMEDY
jgi:hypothetical protein